MVVNLNSPCSKHKKSIYPKAFPICVFEHPYFSKTGHSEIQQFHIVFILIFISLTATQPNYVFPQDPISQDPIFYTSNIWSFGLLSFAKKHSLNLYATAGSVHSSSRRIVSVLVFGQSLYPNTFGFACLDPPMGGWAWPSHGII